jgi:hypothetical protein
MPIVRRNNWTNNAADLEDAQLATAGEVMRVAVGLERLTENLPNPDVVIDRLNVIAGASEALAAATYRGFEDLDKQLGQTGQAIQDAAKQFDRVATETARTAAAVEKIAQQLGEREGRDVGLCTAFYAAAVDLTGQIDRRTHLGQLMDGYETIADLGPRDEFIAAVRKRYDEEGKNLPAGLKAFVTPEVLGCFWERAAGVAKELKRLNPDRPKKSDDKK